MKGRRATARDVVMPSPPETEPPETEPHPSHPHPRPYGDEGPSPQKTSYFIKSGGVGIKLRRSALSYMQLEDLFFQRRVGNLGIKLRPPALSYMEPSLREPSPIYLLHHNTHKCV